MCGGHVGGGGIVAPTADLRYYRREIAKVPYKIRKESPLLNRVVPPLYAA